MTESRVRILETEYNSKNDLIYLNVLYLSGEKMGSNIKLAILGKELMESFNIFTEVPPDKMIKFLKDITGKEINWVVESRIKSVDIDKTEDVANSLLEMDKDPYYEVLKTEMEKQA